MSITLNLFSNMKLIVIVIGYVHVKEKIVSTTAKYAELYLLPNCLLQ